MNLLIPSAKVISNRLSNIGDIPAVIYPINDRIVLDIILEEYKEIIDKTFIVSYEKFDMIKERVETYKTNSVKVLKLDEIYDLGYSILYGLKKIRTLNSNPVLLNFGDTLVMDTKKIIENDIILYSKDYQSNKWTFFTESNGIIEEVKDKKTEKLDQNELRKLFIGTFIIKYIEDFILCLENAIGRKSEIDSFYIALMEYSKLHKFDFIYTNSWNDIGHIEKYYESLIQVKARDFNNITIDKERGVLKKESIDVDKFIGEIKWYLKLPTELEYVSPRIFDYSLEYTKPYVNMEYYSYHTLHELYLYGDLDYKQWTKIFNRIKFIVDDFSKYTLNDEKINDALVEMYLNKTITRLEKLKTDGRFTSFFRDSISVNGIQYQSLDQIMKKLENIIPKMLCNIDKLQIIHGDLCFANILTDDNFNFVKLIDPRGKFGAYDIYGDIRYELAKLFHSIDGKYDYIIKDLFNLRHEISKNTIDFDFKLKKQNFDLFDCLLDSFSNINEVNIVEIRLIESLLFLSMIPLHSESFEHQLVMLGTGVEILDDIIDIKMEA